MSVLVEIAPMSHSKQTEIMRLDITDVTSRLPEQVKQRWGPYKQRQLSKPEVTLEQIQAKMASADQKRQEVLRWVMTRAQSHNSKADRAGTLSLEERARKLEEKLAAAEAKRQAAIDGKRSRATLMLDRTIKVANRLAKKQSDAALKTESSLRSAQAHRQARLAATTAAAQDASMPGSFLQRRAFMRVWLRRQACSRKLQRMWRAFADRHQTSRQLAVSFIRTGIPNVDLPQTPPAATAAAKPTAFQSAERPTTPMNTAANTPTATPTSSPSKTQGPDPAIAWVGVNTHVTEGFDLDPSQQPQDAFENFAKAIQSPMTLKSAKALLTRLEARMVVRSNLTDISLLMQRLFPRTAKAGGQLERYPARIFLCAYMVQSHPEVVFNTQGELEDMLAAAGKSMITAFEALVQQMAQPMQAVDRSDSNSSMSSGAGPQGLGQLLHAFDQAWAAYLQRFVAWKFADAAALEAELIKVAIEMEASVLSKTRGDTSPDKDRSEDLQAVIEQVQHDHSLLKERVARLGGPKATARLEAGLAAARAAALAQSATMPSTSPNSSPEKASSSSGAVPNSPEAVSSGPAAGRPGEGGDENEGMAWELLYNLQWQLPTAELEAGWRDATGETSVMKESQGNPEDNMAPADVASHVQRRVRRIAEQAFWDSVQSTLAESDSGVTQQQVTGQLAGLLAHMGQELMAVLPEQATAAREQLAAELDEGKLQEALTAHQGSGVNGIDTAHLLSVLEHTAQLLKDMGAPAREAAAVAAHAAIRTELSSALQAGDSPALAAAVVKAVRVLMAQLKMLRMDAANFRLKMLAHSLKDGAGIRYAQAKFEAAFGVGQESSLEQMSSVLPHARAWLALVSGQVPQLAQHLQPLTSFAADTNRVQAAASASVASAVPTTLRSGLRASPNTAASALSTDSHTSAAAQLIHPVRADSWRGIVRLGLVHLIQGEVPVEKTALAETLRLDAHRLHLAQNDFQQLVVLAACMLLLHQSLASQQQSGGGASMPEVADVKRRLLGILADPSMRLPDLAAELVRLAGSESDASSQTAMEAALSRMLMRSSGAFKALSSGIGNAIQLQLLASPASVQSDAGLQQAAGSALARCGAVALKVEVAQLAERLSQTAALTEAVHSSTYQKLLSDLL